MEAKRFVEILEEFDCDVRTDYSGRGMYGKTCVAANIGARSDERAICIDVLAGCDDRDREDVAEILRGGEIDSMGKGYVFYFPDLSIDESEGA